MKKDGKKTLMTIGDGNAEEIENRRKHLRFPYDDSVEFHDSGQGTMISGGALNISEGGIALVSEYSLHLDTEINLNLLNKNVSVKGIVRGLKKISDNRCRMSIEFKTGEKELLEVIMAKELPVDF